MPNFGPRVRIQVQGLQELQRALQQLPDELQEPTVTRALMEAAEPIKDDAVAKAPDQPPLGEGLKANIFVSDKLSASQRGDEPPLQRDQARAYVGTGGEKPHIVGQGILNEFGTGPRFHKDGKYVGEMPAQPFMRPAFDGNKRGVISSFADKLRPLIDAAARAVRKGP